MSAQVGFASGCFVATNYDRAARINQDNEGDAFELGCYRTAWLTKAVSWAVSPAARQTPRLTVHTPRFDKAQERRVSRTLGALGLPLVVHADRIHDPRAWRRLGALVLVENIAEVDRFGAASDTLDIVFDALPKAQFCLDVSHAYGAGGPALLHELAERYQDRLAQLHVGCTGVPLWPEEPLPSDAELVRMVTAVTRRLIPVIVERPFDKTDVAHVLTPIRDALEPS